MSSQLRPRQPLPGMLVLPSSSRDGASVPFAGARQGWDRGDIRVTVQEGDSSPWGCAPQAAVVPPFCPKLCWRQTTGSHPAPSPKGPARTESLRSLDLY